MGLFYFTEMQDDWAMNYFMKSSKTNPEHIPNYIYMAKIKLRQNKVKEAGQIIEDKFKKHPDNFRLLELYSFILLKDGKIDAAKNFAEKSLAKDSNSLFALEIMAVVCRLKNNYARAIYYWKSSGNLLRKMLMPIWLLLNYTEKSKIQKCLIRKFAFCCIYRVL